eukprot:1120688-Amphidinium_carterae.1
MEAGLDMAPEDIDLDPFGLTDEMELGDGEEGSQPRGIRLERKPTKAEQERHRLSGHQPHRSWCEFCMRGRGKARSHHSSQAPPGTPKLSIDFMFLGQQDEAKPLTVLVMYDSSTMRIAATVVPGKSADH